MIEKLPIIDEKQLEEELVKKDREITDLKVERDRLWYDNIEKNETNLYLLDKYKTQDMLVNKLMDDLAVARANYKAALDLLAKREREHYELKLEGGKDGNE